MSDVRTIAQMVANDAIEAIDYLTVSETADEMELGMTDDELRAAHWLAVRATAALPEGARHVDQ